MGKFYDQLREMANNEKERKEKLAQQAAPVSFATGERVDQDFAQRHPFAASIIQKTVNAPKVVKTLPEIQKMNVPFTVDRSDYDTYGQRVQKFMAGAKETLGAAKPSTIGTLKDLAQKRSELGREGTGLMMYAGGNGLDQSKVERESNPLIRAYTDIQEKETQVSQYGRDVDYELGENVRGFEDYKRILEEYGNPDERKAAALYGMQHIETGTGEITEKAAAAATDAQLDRMYGMAKTWNEKNIINAEKERRKAGYDEERAGIESELARKNEEISNALYTPGMTQEKYQGLLAEAADLRRRLDAVGVFIGPETVAPETQAYFDWAEAGKNELFGNRYLQEKRRDAADWAAVREGEYQGDDEEKRNANAEIQAAQEELDEALRNNVYYTGAPGSVIGISAEDLAAYSQKAEEAKRKLDALTAQADEKARAAAEENKAFGDQLEAQYGKSTLGEAIWKSTKSGIANFFTNNAATAVDVFVKPWEVLGEYINAQDKNLTAAITGDESKKVDVNDALDNVLQNGMSQQFIDKATEYRDEMAQEAQRARLALTDSPVWDVVQQVYINFIEQVPELAILLAMGLGGAGKGAMDGIARMRKEMMGALEGMQGASQSTATGKAISNMLQNPSFWTTFGREFEDDIASKGGGSTDYVLSRLKGTLEALINSGLEVGPEGTSGWQGFGQSEDAGLAQRIYEKLTGKKAGGMIQGLDRVGRSMIGEGVEEGTQGLNSNAWDAMQRAIETGEGTKVLSTEAGENALVNVPDQLREMAIGGLGGLFMGGAMDAINAPVQIAGTRAEAKTTGQRVIDNNLAQALGGIAEDTAGIRNGLTESLRNGTADLSQAATQRDVGKLWQKTMKKLDKGSYAALNDKMVETITKRLNRNGFGGTQEQVHQAAQTIAKGYTEGLDSLNAAQRALFKNPQMRQAYRGLTGDNTDFTAMFSKSVVQQAKDASAAARGLERTIAANKGGFVTDTTEAAKNALEAAKGFAVSEDGKTHMVGTEGEAEIVGVKVLDDGKMQMLMKAAGEKTKAVDVADVRFASPEIAEEAALAAAIGGKDMANTLFNAKDPTGTAEFGDYAKSMMEVAKAAAAGLDVRAAQAVGLGKGLTNLEARTAAAVGSTIEWSRQQAAQAREAVDQAQRAYVRSRIEDALKKDGAETRPVDAEDMQAMVTGAIKAARDGKITPSEKAALEKYGIGADFVNGIREAVKAPTSVTLAGDTFSQEKDKDGGEGFEAGAQPEMGAATAEEFGRSGRSYEELIGHLEAEGLPITSDVRTAYTRGESARRNAEIARNAEIEAMKQRGKQSAPGTVRTVSAEELNDPRMRARGVNAVKTEYSEKQQAAVDALGRIAAESGLNFVLYESSVNGKGERVGANGFYDGANRTIYLDLFAGQENDQAIMRAAAHEITHAIKDWSPTEYRHMQDYLLKAYYGQDRNTVARLIQHQMDVARQNGRAISETEAMDEVVADASEMMFSNPEVLRGFAQENPTVFQRIKDWIDRFLNTIRKAMAGVNAQSPEARMLTGMEEQWKQYQKLWLTAAKDAAENLRGAGAENVTASTGKLTAEAAAGARAASNRATDKTAERAAFEAAYDAWDKQTPGVQFKIGTPSATLRGLGVPDMDIMLSGEKIKKIKNKHPGMTDDVIRQIPSILESPILVMKSRTVADRLTMFGELTDSNGNPVLAVLTTTPTRHANIDTDFLVLNSAYGKDTRLQGFIDQSEIIYTDKNRADQWAAGLRLYLPSESASLGSDTSIPISGENVNEKNARNRGTAYTNDQTPVQFHYEAVPADSLVTSNNQRFEANPEYPQELQPRDRSRQASRDQVWSIARNLNPARLGESADVQNGAPIVGPDLVVESGNGRAMAIRYAMQNSPEQAGKYTAWLREHAAEFGLNANDIRPDSVLVRVRDSALDRVQFVKQANESTTAAYSESETAESDAEKMDAALMEVFSPGENGSLTGQDNVSFVNRFMREVIPAAERGNYMQQDGSVSQRGYERMQNAIFQKAYGSAQLTQMLSESTDEGVRNALKALLMAAPRVAQTMEAVKKGLQFDIGLGEALTAAARRYAQLKRDGYKVGTYLNQTMMPGLEAESAGAQALMRIFEDYNRAPKQLAGVIRGAMDVLAEYGDPNQTSLLGENTAPGLENVIAQAVARENAAKADGIKYSSRWQGDAEAVTKNGIERGMGDDERYVQLKGSVIGVQDATDKTDADTLNYYKTLRRGALEGELAPIARKLGLIGTNNDSPTAMKNAHLNIDAVFSRRGLHESLFKQAKNPANIAALLPVLRETYENAVPVLVQGDRYLYTVSDDTRVEAFIYLLGAFTYNGKTVPVQFEVKQNDAPADNSLYVVVTIKEDALLTGPKGEPSKPAPASSVLSIEDVIGNVKPEDTNILANLPTQFLTEEQKAGKREGLKDKGAYLQNKAREQGRNYADPVNMTMERLDAEIQNNGAKFSPDYSKAYMAYINPEDFLKLTARNVQRIKNESRALIASELRENQQTPFLMFDQSTGKITGHEGRHRMSALADAGVEKVAILVMPDGSEGKYNRQIIPSLDVTGTALNEEHTAHTVTLDNLIPVNEKHRQELTDNFVESENWFRYSSRDAEYRTNRQILGAALMEIAANAEERDMLGRYQDMAARLDADERRIGEINEELRSLRLDEPNSEREKALLAERRELERGILDADRQLYSMERMAPLQNVANRQRAKAENDLARAKEHMRRYREGMIQREYQARIEKTSRRLAKWLTAPAGKSNNYVPESLRAPLGEFLLTIDKMSQQRRMGGPMTESDRKFAYQLSQIRSMLESIDDAQSGDTESQINEQYGMYMDLPKDFTKNLSELVRRVEDRMESAGAREGGNMLDQMTVDELEALDQSLTAISSSITHINDFLTGTFSKSVSETAAQTIRDMGAYRQQGRQAKWARGITDFVTWDNLMPSYAFDRLGESGKAIFGALREGQSRLAFNAKRVIDESEKIYTAKEAQAWSKEIREFDLAGEKVRMPVSHLMSLYALSRREQGLGHLLGEGIRVADFTEGRNVVHDKGHVISEAELKKMLDTLTPRQKQVAEGLQHLMSTLGSEWGNHVSMRRFGYRQFTERHYFPIRSDSDLLAARTDEGKGNELYRLLNMSMTKPLVQRANNRLMLDSIFDVYAGHMSDMAQYNALALPVLDAVKWINYKESTQAEGESAKYTQGVRDSIRNALGQSAIKYLTEFLKDINGGGMVGDTSANPYQKALGRYNRVAVAANLRVALLQPLAIIRAGIELPGTSLASGTIKAIPRLKSEVEEMQAHSGIALWKDLGYREMNIGRSLKQQIQHMETWQDKVGDKSMALAGLMDNVTWGAMWKASKEYIQHTRPELRAGSKEYFEAVTQKFEDVVYKTQVVDSPLTKSQLMRSQNAFNKLIGSFMSEPTTTFNTLMAAFDGFRLAMRRGLSFSEAWKKNGAKIGRTMFYYLLAAAVNTAIEQAMTAYRDDDDYETMKEKYMDGFWQTMIDNANPLTLIPGIKQIWETGGKKLLGMDTFDDQSVLTQGINTTVDGIQKIMQGKGTAWGKAYTLAKGLSMTSGLPVSPLMREFQALWNQTAARINPNLRLETTATPNKTGYDIMYRAYDEHDAERYEQVHKRLTERGADEQTIQTAMSTRINADYMAGEISGAEAESRLVDLAGKKENDAYFKVQEWAAKAEGSEEDYSRFDALKNAMLTGQGYETAKKELTDHGYTEKQVTAKAVSIAKDAAKKGEITDSQAEQMMVKYGGVDKNDAYFKVQSAHYEKSDEDDSYQKYGKLEEAVLTGKGFEAAKKELTDHGTDEKDVTSKVRSIITEQVVKNGMTDEKAMALLKQYGGMDENEAWIRTQEMAYQKATGQATSSDTAMVIYAVDSNQSPKAAIDGLLAHGKKKDGIASSITSHYKAEYLELRQTNPAQAAELKGRLITIFDYLGYKGAEKIYGWENPKKKKGE